MTALDIERATAEAAATGGEVKRSYVKQMFLHVAPRHDRVNALALLHFRRCGHTRWRETLTQFLRTVHSAKRVSVPLPHLHPGVASCNRANNDAALGYVYPSHIYRINPRRKRYGVAELPVESVSQKRLSPVQ